jgi:hypothetical protein
MKDSCLAVRALNEYRRVSPFSYLALRYYLLSVAARTDRWAKDIATDILRHQDAPAYLACRHYKQINEKQRLEFRNLFFPSANEALAEAALLSACAEAGGPFAPAEDVFSYHLAPPGSSEGIFRPYFRLFAERHAVIGQACRR